MFKKLGTGLVAFFLSLGGINGVILKKTETKIEVLQVFLKQLHIAIVYRTESRDYKEFLRN